MKPSGTTRVWRTLRHPAYGTYVAGNSLSLVGLWVQRVAVGWLTWQLTGSATWLGLMALADLAPAILIGPLGGALADRLDRLRIMQVAQVLALAQAVALWALTASDHITVHLLAVLVLANGVVVGFNQPARLSIVPSLVPSADLSSAVAINAVVFNLARFVGPAIAGAVILHAGIATAFAVNALSYVAILAALHRIRHRGMARMEPASGERSLLGAVVEGARYTAAHPGIGPVLALMLALSIGVRPFVELLPGFADEVFGRGAGALATLASSLGAGAVVAGAWLAGRGDAPGLARLAILHAGLAAVSAATFAFTSSYWPAVLVIGLTGGFLAVAGIGAQICIQTSVDGALRARVMSLYGIVFRAGPAIGALAMGGAADRIGLGAPLAAGAGLTLLVWARVWARRRRIAAGLETGGSGAGQARASRASTV